MSRHYSRQQSQSKKTVMLHDGSTTTSPLLAVIIGAPTTLIGVFSNFWQVYTTQLGFVEMLLDRVGLFGALDLLPTTIHYGTSSPVVIVSNWLLAIIVQMGMIMFTLRVKREGKQQYAHAQGKNKIERGWNASKATTVVVLHNRDLFFYIGMGCFGLDGLGDYAFVTTLTGSIVYMFCYGILIMFASTIMLAYATEWLWIGIESYLTAKAQAESRSLPH